MPHCLKTAVGFGGVPAALFAPSTPGSLRRAVSPVSAVPTVLLGAGSAQHAAFTSASLFSTAPTLFMARTTGSD